MLRMGQNQQQVFNGEEEVLEVPEVDHDNFYFDENRQEFVSFDPDNFDETKQREIFEFLGENPEEKKGGSLELSQDLSIRLKAWIRDGLPKEEVTKLTERNPKTGSISLEAAEPNEEVISKANPRFKARDNNIKNYQNALGSILGAIASLFDIYLHDVDESELRTLTLKKLSDAVKLTANLFADMDQTRRTLLANALKDDIKAPAKKRKSTGGLLFGENFPTFVTTRQEISKVANQITAKEDNNYQQRNNNSNRFNNNNKQYNNNNNNYKQGQQNQYNNNRKFSNQLNFKRSHENWGDRQSYKREDSRPYPPQEDKTGDIRRRSRTHRQNQKSVGWLCW